MKLASKKNLLLYISLLILITISLLNMVNAKLINSSYNNAFLRQLSYYIIGIFIIYIISKINIKKLFKCSFYLYVISIILLTLVLFIGNSINGAKCWLNIFGLSFQPSELCKLSLTLYLIYIVNKKNIKSHKDELILIIELLIITIIPSILVFLEPDTGAIINYFLIFIVIIFYAKLNKWWYITGFIIFLILISSLFILYFFYQDYLINIIGTSFFYRMDRLINFANGNSYQLENALITIGSATFLGTGLNKILLYIPEAPTDFIFAFSIGNYGILSAVLIIISFYIIDSYLICLKHYAKDKKYKMFISSYLIVFIFHQIYNIFMNIGLLPIMGIPLPFLSYGGTNTLINFIYLGIILNMISYKKTTI